MEFLVEFEIRVPEGTSASEVSTRQQAEAAAAVTLVDGGHLARVWTLRSASAETKVLGLYRAASEQELDELLRALPLYEWMTVEVTPLEPHPNDPRGGEKPLAAQNQATNAELPEPRLSLAYRLEATLGEPLPLGETAHGQRRIVPLTGGVFTGPSMSGKLVSGGSADWQVVLPDGTALADLRYTLETEAGRLLYVQARGVRHGSADVLARLARGDDVEPSEYTFRSSIQIETAAAELEWLNKGVFIAVGGREPGRVIYETYLVE